MGDHLYMLNMQSEIYSNYSMNPYYGRISLFRVPLFDYLSEEETSKNFTVCLTDLVPGVITHFSLSNGRLALSYRRLDDALGSVHRFRIYKNLSSGCSRN
jgi:hypothetical protein